MRLAKPEQAAHHYPQPVWPEQLATHNPNLYSALPDQVAGLRPIQLGNLWVVQSWQNRTQPAVLHTLDGTPMPDGAAQYAIQLARHFSGDQTSPVQSVTFESAFSQHYMPINRLLPVWRVAFERPDQLSVLVDIRHDRLATLTDSTRHTLMQLFQWLHVWSFLDADNPLRTPLLLLASIGCAIMGASGLYLYVVLPLRKRKQRTLSYYHTTSGLIISIALLMFSISGAVRTAEKLNPDLRGLASTHTFAVQQLQITLADLKRQEPNIKNAYLHTLNNTPYWQVLQAKQPALWINATNGEPNSQGETDYATQLAQRLLKINDFPLAHRIISNFKTDPNYGFIDKRLPVVALDYPNQSLYIDTQDATLSLVSSPADEIYGWVFRYLHKWRFADGLGINQRDGLMALFILGITATTVLGLAMWVRRTRKRHLKVSAKVEEMAL